MNAYTKKIKYRIGLLVLMICASIGLSVYDALIDTTALKGSIGYDFSCGVMMAFGLLSLVMLVRYTRLLRNEDLLQKEYNKESDERMKSIRAKAGIPILLVLAILIMFAGIVASYFSETICITLMVIGIIELLVSCFVKIYHIKTW
ncbi:MAG: hypothetical protein GX096_14315 [Clostridiales bacterium]|nr:hypothetical protein [Clostridiales bacterium]